MASGIDWFRWHHGSVTDPKFQLVARKAGTSFGNVIAVWAFILESASASEDRGSIGDIDAESIDCLLNAEDGTTCRIISCMRDRGLIDDLRVSSWEKRQPKREDDSAADRKRRQREREHELKMAASVTQIQSLNDTPCHDDVTQSHVDVTAMSRDVTQCHDREEERREEQVNTSAIGKPLAEVVQQPNCPAEDLIRLYHELMPLNPPVKVLNDARRKAIRARWKEASTLTCQPFGYSSRAEGLEAWRKFFEVCSESPFLTGRVNPLPGKPPFVADIDFLFSPSGFAKCLENKYHREVA